jgi:prolyl oligopeptidase
MKKILLALLAPLIFTACSEPVSEPVKVAAEPAVQEEPAAVAQETGQLEYPVTDKVDHVDNYHGTEVADAYRWLEDDVRESEAVSSWVDAQNEVTFAYLDTIEERGAIEARMKELWDYER